jgi:predicted dehydrogenase
MYLKEIQLFMSRAYGPGSYDPTYEKQGQNYPASYIPWTENRNMEECLRLISTGQLRVAPLVTHRFDFEDAPAAYETIMNPASNSLAVLLRYEELPSAVFEPRTRLDLISESPAGKPGFGVGLIGSGNLARWAHLPALKNISGAKLLGVHSASGARGKTYGERFGARYCCTDYEELLKDPAIDVVLIVSRNQHHAAQAEAALRAGKHVFLEKPMALTEAECQSLYRAVNESERRLTVGFNRRFAPYYIFMKKHLARRSGPAVINCRMNSPGISGSYWMADPSMGGAILGEACHFIDLMYWLLESEPLTVAAFSLPTGKQDPIGENNIAATFRFADGSIANLTYCTVGSKTSGGERVEVFAQGIGVVTEDFKHISLRGGMKKDKSRFWAEKGYDAQMEAFFESLRKGETPSVTVVDGARSTIGCIRMLESAREETTLALDLETVLNAR